MDADLPSGWAREYEGRNGVEYFFEPRNLTVSVLPRYDSARERASEMTATGYLVRVHRLLPSDSDVPLTLGTVETFDEAKRLAAEYMTLLSQRVVRQDGEDRAAVLATAALIAPYTDDALVRLVQSWSDSSLRGVAHCNVRADTDGDGGDDGDGGGDGYGSDDGDVTVVFRRSSDDLPDAEARRRCAALRESLAASSDDDEPNGLVASTDAATLAYVVPSGDPAVGTLFLFDRDASLSLPAFFTDTAALLARRQADRDAR